MLSKGRGSSFILFAVIRAPGDCDEATYFSPETHGSHLLNRCGGIIRSASARSAVAQVAQLRAATPNSARQRLASPASLAPKPRGVKDYFAGAGKPELRRTARARQDSNLKPSGYEPVLGWSSGGTCRPGDLTFLYTRSPSHGRGSGKARQGIAGRFRHRRARRHCRHRTSVSMSGQLATWARLRHRIK
jgi:hypothetical protein